MIIFVSAHDEPTRANHAVASGVRGDGDTFIGGADATRESLLAALDAHDGPLFAMSHGDVDKLWAQGRETKPPALDTDNLVGLRRRPVFAHACLTARELGRLASALGSFWWGYQIKVSAPNEHPALLAIFVEVFAFAKASFYKARSKDTREQFFRELSARCDKAKDLLDIIHDQGEIIVPMDAYACLGQLQLDLVVWCPEEDAPRRNPDAGSDLPVFL